MLMLTVTLDTNVLIEFWRQRPKLATVERLLELAQEGEIDVAVTRRIYDDIPRSPLADRIDELEELRVSKISTVFRLDMSVLDGPDVLGSEEAMDAFTLAMQNLEATGQATPDWRDWDHVHSHYLFKRDVFLTWDKAVLKTSADLKEFLGIFVMTPEDFVASFPGYPPT